MRVIRANPEFGKLWAGQAVSAFGSAITTIAFPLTAVGLGVSAFEMGVLSALAVVPHLLFGLPAGVWVDRASLRLVLVGADAGRYCYSAQFRCFGQRMSSGSSVLGTTVGLRLALAVSSAGMLIGFGLALRSPLRSLGQLEPKSDLA